MNLVSGVGVKSSGEKKKKGWSGDGVEKPALAGR